jgi:hypothetical protein
MQLIYSCPSCQKTSAAELSVTGDEFSCMHCDWKRRVAADAFVSGIPVKCSVCSCEDLWRQKDFPQGLGLLIVAAGIILSTIAWYQLEPAWAIGILMVFAALDMLLYRIMKDMLVCYRCRARHRRTELGEQYPGFNLEVAERYRQQALRMEQAGRQTVEQPQRQVPQSPNAK